MSMFLYFSAGDNSVLDNKVGHIVAPSLSQLKELILSGPESFGSGDGFAELEWSRYEIEEVSQEANRYIVPEEHLPSMLIGFHDALGFHLQYYGPKIAKVAAVESTESKPGSPVPYSIGGADAVIDSVMFVSAISAIEILSEFVEFKRLPAGCNWCSIIDDENSPWGLLAGELVSKGGGRTGG